jgi:hypothetical protein
MGCRWPKTTSSWLLRSRLSPLLPLPLLLRLSTLSRRRSEICLRRFVFYFLTRLCQPSREQKLTFSPFLSAYSL